jgi:hypothetical protein
VTLKTEHYVFGLIGIASAIVLYYLWQESNTGGQPATATGDAIPAPQGPTYPNAQPIQLGNVTINDGTAPPEQLYNMPLDGVQLPTIAVGTPNSECGCQDDDCDTAGQPVTVQTIPAGVMQAGADNLASFQSKTNSGVEAARATFSTDTTAPAGGGSLS